MPQQIAYLKETASQTGGPYVHIGLIPHMAGFDIFQNNFGSVLAGADTPGEPIVIEGRVLDGTGSLVRDALIEIWQADADGHYAHPADKQPAAAGFRGWGRAGTDFDSGVYRFETVKPGRTPWRNGSISAPHINVWVVARGINIGLQTRMYFSDEDAANADDPVLRRVEHQNRVSTLIAKRQNKAGQATYTFDIVLQGDNETVFFDV
ncbi:MAG: protocatechuate 3,4-dioxygenase subunit alpha [Pseudolabrys sp.]|jgi:protocatechuate 3,4-dioxygenase alpha subunit